MEEKIQKSIEIIEKYQKEIQLLSQTTALLEWDHQTYMPKNAHISRSEKVAFLKSLIHEKMTNKTFEDSVNFLKDKDLDERYKIMIKRLSKRISKQKSLPKEFVEELSIATSEGYNQWIKARQKKDFSIFAPALEKIIILKRKEAEYYGLPGHPYNSLLDDFEEGMTVERLKPLFEDLKKDLIILIKKIKSSSDYSNKTSSLTDNEFPKENQIELAKEVSIAMGLTESDSRLDFSEHPFSTRIGKSDVRITTNIRDNPMFSFSSTIHEAGHGLYELNLPDDELYTVLGDAPSYGLHESQSRFWELLIGLSKQFWEYYFPKFEENFNLKIDFEDWYKEINAIKTPLIRIESDEIHYCLHIIIRFELELALIEGSLEVKDLKEAWNKKYVEYIGILPPDDVKGVLQDVHWSEGYIGYFPSYAIGTIYASQIFNQIKKEDPKIEEDISNGNFEYLRQYLDKNIHKIGNKKNADDIIKEITGEGLNPKIFIDHLYEKFSGIYKI